MIRRSSVTQWRRIHEYIIMIRIFATKSKASKQQLSLIASSFNRPLQTMPGSFYDVIDRDMDGNQVHMSSFKGSVLCIVNVASK